MSSTQTSEILTATTTTITTSTEQAPTLKLRCHKPKTEKKVQWTEKTVDNEHMGKKKSKCCCIYVKSKEFGESSSESEDECENCHGHVEAKKKACDKPSTSTSAAT